MGDSVRCTCGRDADPVYEEVDIGVGVQQFLVAWECYEHGGICGVCYGCGVPERVGSTHRSWCSSHPGETITAEAFEAETDRIRDAVVSRFKPRDGAAMSNDGSQHGAGAKGDGEMGALLDALDSLAQAVAGKSP
jgi:hypothetical protein